MKTFSKLSIFAGFVLLMNTVTFGQTNTITVVHDDSRSPADFVEAVSFQFFTDF